ncbi:MAG: hypothetical protein JXD23_01880 [Spirochaetales bacterium]|nr:hypothetical protein [Spirochaetales bacterium]
MKKLIALCVLLAFVCGMAFADDGEDGDNGKFLYVQVGASIMYKQLINYPVTGIDFLYNFRAGVTGDLLFSLGMFELGVEIGAYAMEVDYYWYGYGYFLVLEMPLDALIRINFSNDRNFALEVRGGGWLYMEASFVFATVFGYNAGARLVISSFYIGGDYIYTPILGPAWAAEAGVKFSF